MIVFWCGGVLRFACPPLTGTILGAMSSSGAAAGAAMVSLYLLSLCSLAHIIRQQMDHGGECERGVDGWQRLKSSGILVYFWRLVA